MIKQVIHTLPSSFFLINSTESWHEVSPFYFVVFKTDTCIEMNSPCSQQTSFLSWKNKPNSHKKCRIGSLQISQTTHTVFLSSSQPTYIISWTYDDSYSKEDRVRNRIKEGKCRVGCYYTFDEENLFSPRDKWKYTIKNTLEEGWSEEGVRIKATQ